MELPPLRNKVLVLGRSSPAKLFVVRELFRISNQKIPNQLLTIDADDLGSAPLSLPFRVDNKYYTADLVLWVDTAPDAPGTEVVAAYEPIAQAIDALVFIFTDPSSFAEIFPWADFVQQWEPAITLCIQAPSDAPVVAEPVTDVFEWCIDNGFEFIDLTTDDPETDSLFRIYEALQGNMWQGLSKKGLAPTSLQPVGELIPDHDGALPSHQEIELMRKRIFSQEDSDSFAELIKLRDYAQTLSDTHRRSLAAQVALSFCEELGEVDQDFDLISEC